MTLTQGILNKRPALALVTLFCLVEAIWSWTYIIKGVRHRPEIIVALFSAILVFILLSIAYRSSHFQDRIILGAIAAVGVVIAVRALPLPATAMLALDLAKSCLWSITALVSLVILVRGFRTTRTESHS